MNKKNKHGDHVASCLCCVHGDWVISSFACYEDLFTIDEVRKDPHKLMEIAPTCPKYKERE